MRATGAGGGAGGPAGGAGTVTSTEHAPAHDRQQQEPAVPRCGAGAPWRGIACPQSPAAPCEATPIAAHMATGCPVNPVASATAITTTAVRRAARIAPGQCAARPAASRRPSFDDVTMREI